MISLYASVPIAFGIGLWLGWSVRAPLDRALLTIMSRVFTSAIGQEQIKQHLAETLSKDLAK